MTHYIILVVVVLFLVVRVSFRLRGRQVRETQPTLKAPSRARQFVETTFGDVGLVAARELRERTRGRIYRFGTVLMLAIVAAAIVIPTLTKSSPATSRVGVVGTLSPQARAAIGSVAKADQITVATVTEPSLATAERGLRSGALDLVVVDDGDRIVADQAVTPADTSTIGSFAEDLSSKLATVLTVEAAHLSPTQLGLLTHPIAVPITGLTPAPPTKGPAQGTTIIGVILLFVLLSQYSAWILIGVAEEKSSRVVEVLLATVRPIHLLAGKVLGIGTAALAQASLLVVFALVLAKAVGSDILKGAAPLDLASTLLWLVLGYAFYCWVYAAGGSLAERQSQLQSLSFPLSIPMLFGYIISLTTAGSGNVTVFFKVLAYLPPTAPFAMPVLVSLGQATWWEFLLSALLSIAATFGIARVASNIYRRAILRTGRRVKWREVVRAA